MADRPAGVSSNRIQLFLALWFARPQWCHERFPAVIPDRCPGYSPVDQTSKRLGAEYLLTAGFGVDDT
jgi:hypothetical protein